MQFEVIVADPPWRFSDRLAMSDVKRGAEAQYATMSLDEIKAMQVAQVSAPNAILALWVPSSLLEDGLEVMKSWGFTCKQNVIWVKIKNDPFSFLKKVAKKSSWINALDNFDLNDILITLMGRYFRQTHEICLIGTKGKFSSYLKDKSMRSVFFAPNQKHSAKPEILQDRLEKMYPECKYLEIFARRSRPNWVCLGLECPDTLGQDITESLSELQCRIP